MADAQIGDLTGATFPLAGTEVFELDTGTASVKAAASDLYADILAGTAAKATKLATARTINGTSFDGSANITVTAAANTLTGSTLPALDGGSLTNLTAGNITGVVPPANLGTGSSITTKFLRGDGTWQTISGGGDALTSNPLSQFASTTSAQLAGVISDETGTGVLVFSASPTFTGTITAATINATTLTGDGSGVTSMSATQLASGTVPTARLGTGTADTTTFLRGDQSWVVPGGQVTVTTKTANYTLALADLGTLIDMNVGSGNTLTVPPHSSVAFAVGAAINFCVTGAGSTTLTPGAAVTIHTPPGGSLVAPQYAIGTLVQRAQDEWFVTFSDKSALNASNLTTGTLPNGVFPATLPAASGVNLTALNGSNITSGTVPAANLGSGASITTKFLRGDNTWQTISGGGDALTSNPLSQFASTTSAQLAGVISDETGTGVLVFSASPTFTGTVTVATLAATTITGAGSGITSLTATNLSSGTVPTARLGSGTASSSTFLRGDQTWATPSGGGGSSDTAQTVAISGGVLAVDYSAGNVVIVALNANVTSVTVSNAPNTPTQAKVKFILTADGTGRTWPTTIFGVTPKREGGIAPIPPSTSGHVMVLEYIWNDGASGTTPTLLKEYIVAQNMS